MMSPQVSEWSLTCPTNGMEVSPMDAVDDRAQEFLLFAYCRIPLHTPLAYVN
jgi:hypothetical protein